MISLQQALNKAAQAIGTFSRAFIKHKRSSGKWVMQNKNGQNKKERSRNQTMLKGRGCRAHKGLYPSRGEGRTAHGRR